MMEKRERIYPHTCPDMAQPKKAGEDLLALRYEIWGVLSSVVLYVRVAIISPLRLYSAVLVSPADLNNELRVKN